MHCVNCARGVENVLRSLEVKNPIVDFASGSAQFHLPRGLELLKVVEAIRAAGFQVLDEDSKTTPWWNTLEFKFFFSLIWTLPLMAHMFVDWHPLHQAGVQLVLCLPVFCLGLLHFGRSALSSIKLRAANMDVLIVIGITAAFIYSLVGFLFHLGPEYLFFETSASITSLVLLGNALEKRSVAQTTTAIRELSALQKVKARRLSIGSGNEQKIEEVDATDIALNDVCVVNFGDRIPVDGEIIEGTGSVDESMITGESLPLAKALGNMVIAGTILVHGSIRVRAAKVGDDTVLASLIRLVREAQLNKPSIQRLGDRVSAVFVPTVLLIAVATLLITYFWLGETLGTSLMRAIAVLVVACPCAMGLATPTAVMVGLGRAARSGILLKGGQILEELANIQTLIFDKTGTLTTGKFRLKKFEALEGDQAELKSIVRALEERSSHPIAVSLVQELTDYSPFPLYDIKEEQGVGVSGVDSKGERYALSKNSLETQGEDSLCDLVLTKNKKAVARIFLADDLKPEAKTALTKLKAMGLKLVMLSGDSAVKCQNTAAELEIESVFSRHSPAQKLAKLAELEAKTPTGYVGDGINDAPALSQARVGISLSNASQIAIQSAQVILHRGSLSALVEAVHISRLTLKTIKQNLFWAFFYNLLAIPLAAAGYLSPIIAALAMALSDVFVIGNSLRLRLRS
jgi:Cu+-exporting ATPase